MESIMSTLPTLTSNEGSLWIASALSEVLAHSTSAQGLHEPNATLVAATTVAAAVVATVAAATATAATASATEATADSVAKVHDKQPHAVNDSESDLR